MNKIKRYLYKILNTLLHQNVSKISKNNRFLKILSNNLTVITNTD